MDEQLTLTQGAVWEGVYVALEKGAGHTEIRQDTSQRVCIPILSYVYYALDRP
jgi:hypothetical protein